MLERLILSKRERLFVNKRGEEKEGLDGRLGAVRDKKGHEHPFKLFNLMFPQTGGGQRSPRGSQIEPTRGGQMVKNKGWMLEKMQEALKDWQEQEQEGEMNSMKMLMEKLAATQRMMPIPRIG